MESVLGLSFHISKARDGNSVNVSVSISLGLKIENVLGTILSVSKIMLSEFKILGLTDSHLSFTLLSPCAPILEQHNERIIIINEPLNTPRKALIFGT